MTRPGKEVPADGRLALDEAGGSTTTGSTTAGDLHDGQDNDERIRQLVALVAHLATDSAATQTRLRTVEHRLDALNRVADDLEELLAQRPPGPSPGADDTTGADGGADGGVDGGVDGDSSDLDGGTVSLRPAGETPKPGEGETRLDMQALVTWVEDNIALLLERKIPQTGGAPMWCRSWWLHPEAIARFEAARRAWTEALADEAGSGLAVYFEHLDHQLGALMAENGPFHACKGGNHPRSADGNDAEPVALGQLWPGEDYFLEFETARDEVVGQARP